MAALALGAGACDERTPPAGSTAPPTAPRRDALVVYGHELERLVSTSRANDHASVFLALGPLMHDGQGGSKRHFAGRAFVPLYELDATVEGVLDAESSYPIMIAGTGFDLTWTPRTSSWSAVQDPSDIVFDDGGAVF